MLPKETLLEILAHLHRRDLDALELVNRALGSLVAAKFSDSPIRVISLMFCEEGLVMLMCPLEGWRRVRVAELPRYLPHSVITKMVFKWPHVFTEDTYQALRPCRAHFDADAVCHFRLLSGQSDVLHRALTEVFMCRTLVFAEHTSAALTNLREHIGEQDLAALPCFANCANLQIAHFDAVFSDATGVLEWLLGTNAATAGAKHLSITETSVDFFVALDAAIKQQFLHATTPTSFVVELTYSVGHRQPPNVRTTRELENAVTKELLTICVDTGAENSYGEPTYKLKVTIQRKPAS